jgi:hypothetical protein
MNQISRMHFTPFRTARSVLVLTMCMTFFASLTQASGDKVVLTGAKTITKSIAKTIADSAVGTAINSALDVATDVAINALAKTAAGEALTAAGASVGGGFITGVVGTASAILGTLKLAMGPGADIYAGDTDGDNRSIRDYYKRLWGIYLPTLNTKEDALAMRQLLDESAALAGMKYGEYVEKNHLSWCGKNLNTCQLNFPNVFISNLPISRVQQIKGHVIWEISGDVLFPLNNRSREDKKYQIATEILRLANEYDFDGMKRKTDSDFTRHDWIELDYSKRCRHDLAKTVMAAEILGQKLDKLFFDTCRLDAKVIRREPEENEINAFFLKDVDASRDTLEHRVIQYPQYHLKIVDQGSTEDKSVDRCTMKSVTSIIPEYSVKEIFGKASEQADQYFQSYVSHNKLNWCGENTICSQKYSNLRLSENPTLVQTKDAWNIPYKIFCGFQNNLKDQYIHYLAIELLRKTPSKENSPSLFAAAQRLNHSQPFNNGLVCEEAANSALGFLMAGVPADIKYLNSLCRGLPLQPPGVYNGKVYRGNNTFRAQTMVQPEGPYRYPILAKCGPGELQELFLAELPLCQSYDLRPINEAVKMYGDEISEARGSADQLKIWDAVIQKTSELTAILVAGDILIKYVPKRPLGTRVMLGASRFILRKTLPKKMDWAKKSPSFLRGAYKLAAGTVAGQIAGLFVDFDKIFPSDLLYKAWNGNIDAKEALKSNLERAISPEGDTKTPMSDATFSKILFHLSQSKSEGERYIQLVEQEQNRTK